VPPGRPGRRDASSSVAPVFSNTSAPCVLASHSPRTPRRRRIIPKWVLEEQVAAATGLAGRRRDRLTGDDRGRRLDGEERGEPVVADRFGSRCEPCLPDLGRVRVAGEQVGEPELEEASRPGLGGAPDAAVDGGRGQLDERAHAYDLREPARARLHLAIPLGMGEHGHEALQPEYRAYQQHVVANCQTLANEMARHGARIVSGGTDNHLILVDVFSRGLTGKAAEAALGKAGITVNKNAIPFDPNPPMVASGVRIGTPAVTTRGMGEREMEAIGELIARVLASPEDDAVLGMVRNEVEKMCRMFPLYSDGV